MVLNDYSPDTLEGLLLVYSDDSDKNDRALIFWHATLDEHIFGLIALNNEYLQPLIRTITGYSDLQ